MKNLLSLPFIILFLPAFAQTLEGVNEEHMIIVEPLHQPAQITIPKDKLIVQKIILKNGITIEYVEKGDVKRTPVIFFHGLTDPGHSFESFCFRKRHDILSKNIKNVKFVVYEGIGHALHWEEAKR